jgi:aminoglycoside 3-N-acetyltransferase
MSVLRYYAGQVLRRWFPQGAVRRVRKFRTALATRRKAKLRERIVAQYGYFNAADLRKELLARGVRPGGVLLVHSSFDAFSNFQGTPLEVLEVLEEIVGPDGTLLMPAQPPEQLEKFDVRRTPASTGLICELFRRREGTRRSLYPSQSACAKGPLAEELVKDHHRGPLGCGPQSPFAKLVQHRGQILTLGAVPINTFLHVIEDLDLDKFPRRIYSNQQRIFRVINERGEESVYQVPVRDDRVLVTLNVERVTPHLSCNAYRSFSIHGVSASITEASLAMTELQHLAQHGNVIYA